MVADEVTRPSVPDVNVMRERQMNNERAIISLQGEVREIHATMATQADVRVVTTALTTLSTKIDQIGRPQWTAISVGISIIVILGGLVYWPIRDKQSDQAEMMQSLRSMIERNAERGMSRVEIEREWTRRDKWTDRIDERVGVLERETWSRSKTQ